MFGLCEFTLKWVLNVIIKDLIKLQKIYTVYIFTFYFGIYHIFTFHFIFLLYFSMLILHFT